MSTSTGLGGGSSGSNTQYPYEINYLADYGTTVKLYTLDPTGNNVIVITLQ
jgi:hypothetical protein